MGGELATTPPRPGIPEGRSGLAFRVLCLSALATFFDGYDVQALGLVVPSLARHFGVSPPDLAPALAASIVGMAIGAIVIAPMADRFGRRAVIVAMHVLVGTATLICVYSGSPTTLAFWRMLAGIGLGAILPISVALAIDYAPAKQRARLTTLIVAASPLGSVAAGFAAPVLQERFGWEAVFGVGGAFPLVTAVALYLLLPTDGPNRCQFRGGTSPSLMQFFAVDFRARTFACALVCLCNLFTSYALISWLPTLLVQAGWELPQAQRATGLMSLGAIAGGLLMAWLVDKTRSDAVLICGYLVAAVSFLALAFAPENGAVAFALVLLVGLSQLGTQVVFAGVMGMLYPRQMRATSLGAIGGIGRIGAIAAPLFLGAMMRAQVPPSIIFASLAVPMILSITGVLLLRGNLNELDKRRGADLI